MSLASVGTKSTVVKMTIKDPSGKSYVVSSTAVAKNKAYSSPIIKFAKVGTFTISVNIGTSKRVVTVKVTA
jgi:hypothetical protein